MAFGISKLELRQWKRTVSQGDIAFLTHFWWEPRFPNIHCVTKVGCSDLKRLVQWCKMNQLSPQYIHHRDRYPHFDLIGPKQKEILTSEGYHDHILRFRL